MRFSGFGGQGLILIGIIMAEAVGIYGGKFVVQTQSYGPEARGGASRSELVISEGEIDYPKPIRLDLLLSMNQESLDLYYQDLKEGGILVVDSTYCRQIPLPGAIQIPFTRIAREHIGRDIVANIIALGAIGEITALVEREGIKKATLNHIPRGTEELNLKALEIGFRLGEKARGELARRGEEDYIIVDLTEI